MRENNDMENLMKLKMDEFLVEPAASDWQAIYDQLHPRQRRRFVWWWLPLAAGLSLFGAYWLFFEAQNETTLDQQPKSDLHSSVPDSKIQDPNQASPATPGTKPKGPNESISVTPNTIQIENKSTSVKEGIEAQDPVTLANTSLKSPKPQISKKAGSQQTANPEDFASGRASEKTPHLRNNITVRNIDPGTPTDPIDSRSIAKTNSTPPPADSLSPGQEINTGKDQSSSNRSEPITAVTTEPAVIAPDAKTNSIPKLSNHSEKGWYLGIYTGFGINKPTKAMTMTKSADMISFPSSGNSFTSVSGQDKNGYHFDFGVAIDRKMKKMSLSTGLGLQINTWSTDLTIYKDSITNGSFLTRTLVGNTTANFKHFAIEIPLILNFKIAGKKQHTYWINTGLNNAITLELNKNPKPTAVQGSVNGLDNTSADPSTYQPQFRLGLMYENAQKSFHFQLSPFMQYGLNNMTKSGTPDIQMLHFGVQGRYFFKRLR